MLKLEQIVYWRERMLEHAGFLQENPSITRSVARFLTAPCDKCEADLRLNFTGFAQHFNYADILLVDSKGKVLLSLNGGAGTPEQDASVLTMGLRGRKPVLGDLYADGENHGFRISVAAPLFTGDGPEKEPACAVILVRDASRYFLPLLRSWPTPAKTAETLLVRRNGREVVFISDLRHRPDSVLKLHAPLSRTDMPAVRSATGRRGIFYGTDYRGVRVISAVAAVPDSPWFLVAKIDSAEAFAEWRSRARFILLLVAGLMGITGLLGLSFLQHERKRHYRKLYLSETALRAAVERHSVTLRSIGDAVIATDASGRIELLNAVAEALTGWRNEEARGRPLEEVFAIVSEITREKFESPVARVLREGTVVGLENHTLLLARDGTELAICDSASPIRAEDGDITGVVLIFRDQTPERLAQRMVEARLDLIEYASAHTMDELLTRALDEISALLDSPVGFYHFVESDQRSLTLQQWSSRTLKEYCRTEGKGLHYDIEKAGVWADCVREAKPVIHNDYNSLEHKKGMPEGHAALVRELVVPVMREGKVVAILGIGNKPVEYTENDAKTVAYFADVTWEIVERKRVEEALRQSEEKFRVIFQTSPDPVAISRLSDGMLLDISDSFIEAIGYTRDEVVAKTTLDLNIWRDVAQREKLSAVLRDAGSIENMETEFCAKDGKILTCLFSACVFRVSAEELILSVTRDITDRKRAEDALRESEARYRAMFELNRTIQLIIEPGTGTIVDANPSACDFYGRTRGEMQSMRIMDINTLEEEDVRAQMELARAEARDCFPFRHRLTGGEVRDVEVYSGPIPSGNRTLLHSIIHDVSERKRIENDLKSSEERLRLFIEHAPASLAMFDREMRYIAVSRRWLKDFNKEGLDCKGLSHYEDFPDVSEQWKQVHRRGLAGEVVRADHDRFDRADGTVQWLRWEVRPWRDATGNVDGIVIFTEDVTERKIIDDTRSFLAQSGWSESGESFFDSLARELCQKLGMEYARIDRLADDGLSAATLAVFREGGLEENFTYTLKDTPWNDLVEKKAGCFTKDVRHLFPEDPAFLKIAAESYAGTILKNSQGRGIGLIAVAGRKAPANPRLVETVLEMAAIRAAGELERKLTEEALRDSEHKFSVAFRNSPATAAITALEDGTFLDVSNKFLEVSGFTRDEVLGKTSVELGWLGAEDRRKILDGVFKDGRVSNMEVRLHAKDGSSIDSLLYSDLVTIGGIKRLLTVSTDISERRKAENALKQQLNFQQILMDTIPIPIFYKDTEGRYLGCNQSYASHTGFSEAELVGKTVYDVFPPDMAAVYHESELSLLKAAGARQSESILRSPDGAFRNFIVSMATFDDLSGKVAGLVGAGLDITERKQTEQELNRYRDHLQDLVGERTSQLLVANDLLHQEIEERKRAEKELRAVSQQWRTTFDAVEDAIFLTGPSNEIIRSNKAATDLIRPDSSVDVGPDSCTSILTVLGPVAEYAAKRTKETGRRTSAEVAIGKRWFSVSVDPVREEDSSELKVVHILRDFTKQKRADEKLRESEEKYRSIFEHSTLGIFRSHPEGGFIDANSALARMLGYESPKDLIAGIDSIPEAIYAGSEVRSRLKRKFEEGDRIEAQIEFRRKDLTTGTANIHMRVVRDENRALLYMEGFCEDITERKLAEEQLQASKLMLQKIFDGISDPLVIVDRGGLIRMLNKATRDHYKLNDYADAVNKPCFEAFYSTSAPCRGCEMPFTTMGAYSGTYERKGGPDSDRLEQVVVYALSDEHGEPDGAIIRIADITKARLLEKQLLQNEKLASLGLLVAGIAHEINNPNSFIVFNIPILRTYMEMFLPMIDAYVSRHPESEFFGMSYEEFRTDIYKLLENMEHGAHRISTIVSMLKSFSRQKEGKEQQRIDLHKIIEQVVAICRGEIRKRVKSFHLDVPQDLGPVLTDAEAVEQILINLIINAAHAADKQDSWIKLSVRKVDTDSGKCVIEVSDNGCGMDETTMKKIFDPFFTTKSSNTGTGLGLYICHNLAASLGASIEAESAPGKGCTFRLTLNPQHSPKTENEDREYSL